MNYSKVDAAPGTVASLTIGGKTIIAPDRTKMKGEDLKMAIANFNAAVVGKAAVAAKAAEGGKPAVVPKPTVVSELSRVGYPTKADAAGMNKPLVILLLTCLVLLVTMVYGSIAAMLVELFPSRIRYTSMSLPYHIGNGWFGGFLPTIAFAMVAATGSIYYGLWYPVVASAATVVIGIFFLPETYKRELEHQA